VKAIFDTMLERAKYDAEELRKSQVKKEEKFRRLLEDYYYRSDHIDTSWSDAKKDLSKHSVYDSLSKTDKKRLFAEHIDSLKEKMHSKRKSMESLFLRASESSRSSNESPNDGSLLPAAILTTKADSEKNTNSSVRKRVADVETDDHHEQEDRKRKKKEKKKE
jgi:hypothetical protein